MTPDTIPCPPPVEHHPFCDGRCAGCFTCHHCGEECGWCLMGGSVFDRRVECVVCAEGDDWEATS